MKFILSSVAALAMFATASASQAAQTLQDNDMDQVTAGAVVIAGLSATSNGSAGSGPLSLSLSTAGGTASLSTNTGAVSGGPFLMIINP